MVDILVFLVVLGVLVFVHELGHFAAAKACGIYVDRFSLGMPPRLFGFKIGETDYCIGALPIGGYVKMAGQEDAPLSEDERQKTYGRVPPERWFNNKPRWQRAFVLVAGPAMNLVLAFVIFAGMAAVGGEVPLAEIDNRIGVVEPNSPAESAPLYRVAEDGESVNFSGPPESIGWKTGDRILSINGNEVTRITDVAIEGVLGKGKVATVLLERAQPDGATTRYVSRVEPKVLDDKNFTRFGVQPFDTGLVRHVLPDTPAEKFGLRRGDEIVRMNGDVVDSATFSLKVKDLPPGTRLDLAILRDGQLIPLTLETQTQGRFDEVAFSPPLQPLLLLPDNVTPKVAIKDAAFTAATTLRKGDAIVEVNGEKAAGQLLRRITEGDPDEQVEITVERADRWFGLVDGGGTETLTLTAAQLLQALIGLDVNAPIQIAGISGALKEVTGLQRKDILLEVDGQPATPGLLREIERTRAGESVPVKVRRPAIFLGLAQGEDVIETELPVASVEMIGVVWDTKMAFRRVPPAEVLPEAWNECKRVVVQTYAILAGLLGGSVSPTMLGGPVMIFDLTTQAARMNFMRLVEIVAIISVNLAIFNLLPLPVLDGGQLLFLGIEGVRRKPVNVKVMEMVQQAGILFILGLIVYVTFNDISRVVERFLP
jgi:RIP metalloprotease RseP